MPDRVFLVKKQGENRGRSDPRSIGLRSSGACTWQGRQACKAAEEARQTSSAILFREVLVISNNKVIIQDIERLVKRKIESIPLGIV